MNWLPYLLVALGACATPPSSSISRPDVPSVTSDPCDAPEICDGVDNNCDGQIDEGLTGRWYLDEDGDEVGGAEIYEGCHKPAGYAVETGDCDDNNAAVYPLAVEVCDGFDNNCDGVNDLDAVDLVDWHPDEDGDGVGDSDFAETGCNGPLGWVSMGGDCDDTDPLVYDGAPEACNQQDDNCDGLISDDEFDWDFDTYPACAGDCDENDIDVHPGAVELVYDGVDNDCDLGTLDDDLDADGFGHLDDCDDQDPAVNPGNAPPAFFVDVTQAAGLYQTGWDQSQHVAVCGYEILAGGVAAADYDADGYVDLFVPVLYDADQLYRNQGDGTFVDVAATAGLDHDGATTTGVWLDLEGDGDLDLYILDIGTAPARLYVNDGTGVFTEEAQVRGVDIGLPPVGCSYHYGVSAADVDGDGDIDLHTSQWQIHPDFVGDRSRFFINDGSGFFSDGTAASGVDLHDRAAFTANFGDFDRDGILDLAVSADWEESGLYMGLGGGIFDEVTQAAGVGTDENGMGGDLADFDQDGDLDWFVTAIYDDRPCGGSWGCTGNRLYVNDGSGVFTDGTTAAGVREGSWGWGAAFLDFDNDGDLDLAETNGFPADDYFVGDSVRLWVNDGNGVFDDRACDSQIDLAADGRALIPIDYDNDGDLDIFTTVNGAPPHLYENVNSGGTWLRVLLDDGVQPGNPNAIGAIIEVEAANGGTIRRRDVHANSNFSGTRPAEVHFGLGGHVGPLFEVRVTWPDGIQSAHINVGVDQIITLSR